MIIKQKNSFSFQDILEFSKDYRHMTKDKAMDDFHHKIEHYKEQYEPINPKLESRFSYIKVFNGGEYITLIS